MQANPTIHFHSGLITRHKDCHTATALKYPYQSMLNETVVDGSISFLQTFFRMFWNFFSFALKSASVHLCPCCSTLMPGTVRFFSKRSRNLYVALMSILYGTPWLGKDQEMSASSSRVPVTLLPFHLSKYESPSELSQDSSLQITCKFKQIKFSGYAIKYVY